MTAADVAIRNAYAALALVEALTMLHEALDFVPHTAAGSAFADRVGAFARDVPARLGAPA